MKKELIDKIYDIAAKVEDLAFKVGYTEYSNSESWYNLVGHEKTGILREIQLLNRKFDVLLEYLKLQCEIKENVTIVEIKKKKNDQTKTIQ